tara:strand:- start:882 stop:1679 length:798 start_codon:yes stop_codon:yes gene_type:complete
MLETESELVIETNNKVKYLLKQYKYEMIITFIISILIYIILNNIYSSHKIKLCSQKIKNLEIPMYSIYIPKRENHIKNFFEKYKLDINFIQGVDKDTINVEDLIKKNKIKRWKEGTPGRIACHYSHLKVMKQFLNTPNERCVIFEDDLKSSYSVSDLLETYYNLLNNIPKDCDILYIGYCFTQNIKKYNKYFSTAKRPVCRHAYSVNRKAANEIIKNTEYMTYNGDQLVANLCEKDIIKAYLSNYNIFEQSWGSKEPHLWGTTGE